MNGLVEVRHTYVFDIWHFLLPWRVGGLNPAQLVAGQTDYGRGLVLDSDSEFSLRGFNQAAQTAVFATGADIRFTGGDGRMLQTNFLPRVNWISGPVRAPVYVDELYPAQSRLSLDFRDPIDTGAINLEFHGVKRYRPGARQIYAGPSVYRDYLHTYAFNALLPATDGLVPAGAFFAYSNVVRLDSDADFVLQWIGWNAIADDSASWQDLRVRLYDPFGVMFSSGTLNGWEDLFCFGGGNGLWRPFVPEHIWPAGSSIIFDLLNFSPDEGGFSASFQLTFGGVKRYRLSSSVPVGRRGFDPAGPAAIGAESRGGPGTNWPAGESAAADLAQNGGAAAGGGSGGGTFPKSGEI